MASWGEGKAAAFAFEVAAATSKAKAAAWPPAADAGNATLQIKL